MQISTKCKRTFIHVLEFSQSSQGPHRREYFSKQTTRCRMVVYNKRSRKKAWPLKSVIARQFFWSKSHNKVVPNKTWFSLYLTRKIWNKLILPLNLYIIFFFPVEIALCCLYLMIIAVYGLSHSNVNIDFIDDFSTVFFIVL